jgi:hypothetical protein
MKARLLIVNPQNTTQAPVTPSYLIENDGMLQICSGIWTRPVRAGTLADVTVEDLRASLPWRESDRVYLSDIRDLPDTSYLTPEFSEWLQRWWEEESLHLRDETRVQRVA